MWPVFIWHNHLTIYHQTNYIISMPHRHILIMYTKSTEKHQELQLQLLKKKDQVLLYSLQPLAAPAQATRMHQLFKPQYQKLQHLLKDHFSKSFLEHPKDQWPPFLLVVWCQVLKISSWKMIPFLNLCYYFLYCLMTSTWRYCLL